MRINGISKGPMAGVADQIIEQQRQPIEALKQRAGKVQQERNEFNSFESMVSALGKSVDGLRTETAFQKLAVNSSHPDIIKGELNGLAELGTYEFEVKDMARAGKQLAMGFENPTEKVGFGYMSIAREGMSDLDVTIDPGSSLQDVAERINGLSAGVKAKVINTGIGDEPFRLLVSNTKTGELSGIKIDPDTTFTDFKEQVKGSDLKVSFEDVDVQRAANSFNDLVNGVTFNALRAAPGTKVRVDVTHDVPTTIGGIKAFTDSYNKIAQYTGDQFKLDPQAKVASGALAGDSSLRSVMRQLQGAIGSARSGGTQAKSLAEVGITTDAKSGLLNVDEAKLTKALGEDYDGVASLFAKTENGNGVADRLAQAIKAMEDPQSGVLKTRKRGLDSIIKQQDKNIATQTARIEQKEEHIRRTFSNLESKIAATEAQSATLQTRFAEPAAPSAAGNGPKLS